MIMFNIIDSQSFRNHLSPVLCSAAEIGDQDLARDSSGGVWHIVRRGTDGHPSIVALKTRGEFGLKGHTYPVSRD